MWADHDRMEQVFVNLLNNAFGHNPPGTKVRRDGHNRCQVVISVIDDGLGMPPELIAGVRHAGGLSGAGNSSGPAAGSARGLGPVHRQGDRAGARRQARV